MECPACGADNPPTNNFCGKCGAALAVPPPSPEAYTPRHLAEKILAGRDALAGERKLVTVLFADVVGSTELIRDRDPEDAQRLLDGAVQRMMSAVHRYEGTVSRLMGDGLMALFGAPIAHEDHAVRACYAALAMLQAAREYVEEARQAHGARIEIRVGVNSGEVVVRLVSDDLHMDYTAMGQTVHLASRMEGLARAGAALLTATTLALVEGFVEVRPLGPTPVKGLDQPAEVYELVGAGAARTRLQAAAARGLTPFVGRLDERAAIDRALERARAGQGQVVALVAEPGVGKSRLLWEVTRDQPIQAATPPSSTDPAAPAWTILEASSLSYGQTTSWLPVIGLLKAYCQIERRDDREATRDKVTGRVLGLHPSLGPALPALLQLLDVPIDDAAWAALDPPRRRRRTLDAIKQLLLRASQEGPLLLVFEDLHWIDSETQALLDELVENLPLTPTLLLVSYRPEYQHGWASKGYYTQIRIDPLPVDGAAELLGVLLGADPTLRPLEALLTARTGGNPFFLEESVRALVETGALVGERGAYRLTRPVDDVRVPSTVQAVLAARIDRLSPSDKRLLQTAAAIGKDLSLALLRATAERSDDEVPHGLARLQAAELLYPARLFPEPEYTFKHALTHEVAYAGLLQERRRTLHGRILSAIETLYPGRLSEHVEELAHHALRGERWEQATVYCRQAGLRALSRSIPREGAGWFEQGLAALRHLPESRDTLEQAIDLTVDLRNALNPIGEIRRAFGFLVDARAYAGQLHDRQRLARILVSMNSHHYMTGDVDAALACAERALAIGIELEDVTIQAGALHNLGQNYHAVGQYRQAAEHFRRALDRLDQGHVDGRQPLGSYTVLASHTRSCLAWTLAELGDLTAALTLVEAGVRVSQEAGHGVSFISSQVYLGIVRVRTGAYQQAVEILEPALELLYATNLQVGGMLNGIGGSLGDAYVQVGRVAEAIPLLEQTTTQMAAQGVVTDWFLGAIPLAEAYLLATRPDDAIRLATHNVELAARHGEHGFQAWALRALGEVHASRDPPDPAAAEVAYRESLARAEELEMRPLQARCHLGLGKLYCRAGRLGEARVELTAAIGMLREMEMTFWLPQAEAELATATSATSAEQAG
ncbi:MAG: AAA family ATPase [Chloroflexi bacterium]|nr:AAA family ATPase [Chloroflexota bacterium]